MNNSFNTHTNHALIQREQTYVIEKKLLTVHSEDRDFTQFPNSNHFSLAIGESMNNVESISPRSTDSCEISGNILIKFNTC